MPRTGPKPGSVARFRAHREYEERKDAANNALMGLLAGAQLSAHFLQLTRGSDLLLPDIFPNIAHIKRFSLRSDRAADILGAADAHLGMMAVPYVLSLHEDYLRTCAELLRAEGLCNKAAASANLNELHANIAKATGQAYTSDIIAYIDALRLMRNCVIHNGGQVSQQLLDSLTTWNQQLKDGWYANAKRDPTILSLNDVIEFGHGEMITVLAVTKRLDRETNIMLQTSLPRDTWADMVIADVEEQTPSLCIKNPELALRKATGIARHHYLPLGLAVTELKAAVARQ
ncbi:MULTISPECIES: hypothetical protein [Actinomycetes]|uniref:hypothetical protein n=1 Tax=Actinomycetes TaxID=1760 RepID=UPI0004BE54DE|nr:MULTISPECIES: hypothetical protein [Actinomycetes]